MEGGHLFLWSSVPVKAKGTWTDFAMVYHSILVGLCFLQLSTLLTAPLISAWTWKRINLAWPQKHHPIVWHDPLMSQEACFTKGNDLEPSQSRMKTAGLANTECFHGSRKLCDILGVCIIAKARSILKYWKADSIWATVTFPYNYITIFDIHHYGCKILFYRKKRCMTL